MDEGVRTRIVAGILFERFHYGPGPRSVLDPHTHDGYQWCLSVDHEGLYDYRGARHGVPATAISVIHPGEPHACLDPADRDRPSTYLMATMPVELVAAVADEAAPYLGGPVTLDDRVRSAYVRLHRASTHPPAQLALDAALADLVEAAVGVMTSRPLDQPRPGRERAAVTAAVAHLRAHVAEPVRAAELAAVSGLSQRHLHRAFTAAVGVTPHRYQLQLRVDAAKAALAAGGTPAEVAVTCGFVDQSHLARHFRRWVGVPPGRYRAMAGTS